MKLNPQQAPLYGECLLTVQLCDGECSEDQKDVEFYLLFTGTTQRHLSSTQRIDHVTLQAVCPAHDCCEAVQVILCSTKLGGGPVELVAEDGFHYVQDLASNMAQLLVGTAGQAASLECAAFLDECRLPPLKCEQLDKNLALALRHLTLPQGWSVLGTNLTKNAEPASQETLLHFVARPGLRRAAVFLLQQPGDREALRLPNKQGVTPLHLAENRGHCHLQQLFSQEETSLEASRQILPGRRVLQHHPRLNTYTLTVGTAPGCPPSTLQKDVEELRSLIRIHKDGKGLQSFELHSELLNNGQEHSDSVGTAAEKAGLKPLDVSLGFAEATEKEAAGRLILAGNCAREGDPSHSSGSSENSLNNGNIEDGVCKGGEEGALDAGCVVDAGNAPGNSNTVQSQLDGKSCASDRPSFRTQLEETDTTQCSSEVPYKGDQEEESTVDRADETQPGDSAPSALSSSTIAAGMGHTQSLGSPETPARSQRAELGERGITENLSGSFEELHLHETESSAKNDSIADVNSEERPLLSSTDAENGKETRGRSEAIGSVSEHSCNAAEGQSLQVAGGKWQEASDSEQIQETAAQDNPKEIRCNVVEVNNNRARNLEQEPDYCEKSCPKAELGSGKLSEPASGGLDSVLPWSAMALWDESPKQSLSQSAESTCVHVGAHSSELALYELQLSPTATHSEEKTSGHMTENSAVTSQWERRSCALETVSESWVRPSPEGHITSIPSPAADSDTNASEEDKRGLCTDDGAAAAAPGADPALSSDEDSFQSVSSSTTESFHLPEGGEGTESFGEMVSTQAKVEMSGPLDTEKTLSCSDSEPPTEITGAIQQGEDCREIQDTKPEFQQSFDEVTTEAWKLDPSAEAVLAAPRGDVPWKAPEGHCEGTGQTEWSEVHGESDGKTNQQNIPEPDVSEYSLDGVGGEADPEGPALTESRAEAAIAEQHDSRDEGDLLGTQQTCPKVLEITTDTDVVSRNDGGPEIKGLQTVLEGTMEGISERPVDILCCHSKAAEVSQQTDVRSSVDGEASAVPLALSGGMEPQPREREATGSAAVRDAASLHMMEELNSPLRHSSALLDTPHSLDSVFIDEDEDSEDSGHESHVWHDDEGLQTTAVIKDGETRLADVSERQRTSASDLESDTGGAMPIHRERDAFFSIDACSDPDLLGKKQCDKSGGSPRSPSPRSLGSSTSTTPQDSGINADGFLHPDTGDDDVFRKVEGLVPGVGPCEVSLSCSSTEKTVSVEPACSTQESCAEGRSWRSEEAPQPTGGARGEEAKEEEKDRLTEAPLCATILRSSVRSLSPFRRHSWGPGKNPGGEAEMSHRSSSRSLGERKPTFHRRSMSWCPSGAPLSPDPDEISSRSYSLEGLTADRNGRKEQGASPRDPRHPSRMESEERGSLVSLTEEEQSDLGECGSLDCQKSGGLRPVRHSCPTMTVPLTKSVSMLAISQKDLDDSPPSPSALKGRPPCSVKGRTRPKRRISFSFNISPILPKSKTFFSIGSSSSDDEESLSLRSYSSGSGSLAYSISEEDPGPLRSDIEGKSGTTVSRTFSYLKSKMYKKTKEKEKERSRDKDRETKEREKRSPNGHFFSMVNPALPVQCHQCSKVINAKEAFFCPNCNAHVHKGCRENLLECAKVKMKLQKQPCTVPDSAPMPAVTLRNKCTSLRERPWSAITVPDDRALMPMSRRHTSIMPLTSSNLSKSISISNIAGSVFDEIPLKGLRYLSLSTDSLQKTSKVNESTESLTDEGTEMMDSQLMGEFETDAKELEADSWSFTVDKKYLKQLKKDTIKRQNVIYELIQTEMHHVRTLKIMSDVYSKGLLKEVQLEVQTVERVFPMLDEILDIHTLFFTRILERKRESKQEGKGGDFIIRNIGDVLISQFSGPNAERMKKVYGKFCSRHNDAVNFYKELQTKDKRFQAFIKKKMSSTIVRRLSIPECILLVTQRITKYPVLLQRILQHTKEGEDDHEDLTQALQLMKELIAAVDRKVSEHQKKKRLKEVHSRTDSKSIMHMKSGQMFAKEDLVRGRRLLHDGPLQLKNSVGRLKDVQAMLLSDVFVFLQEKDQKYVFASLDQRSTVISLQNLIVREVANEERGLFLITVGIEKPEMVEVLASSKEERNTWMQLIQDAMHSIRDKDEDEGIPSETEEDKRLQETKAKEMRDLLRKKDEQIVALLEEKVKLFHEICECTAPEDSSPKPRMLFRASMDDVPKGEPILKDALKEVETLQTLVTGSLGGAVGQQVSGSLGSVDSVGPVCLPRRAETFGGFDSHQMNISKNGEKPEGEDSPDLRRTESDSILKKGGNANLLLLLKRNSEQFLHSVAHLHDLLNTLQAVVVQQDSFLEDQRQALSERPASRPSSRPNSLIEQEKQRSLEKQRQEMANLQRLQATHAVERQRRERQWEAREQELVDMRALLQMQEEEAQRRQQELEVERQELQERKEEYQRDLERLRDAQRKLDRDREQAHRESLKFQSTFSPDKEPKQCELSSSPQKDPPSRLDSKRKKKNFKNPFTSNSGQVTESCEGQSQIPSKLLQLAKTKEKKKKKGKGQQPRPAESQNLPGSEPPADGEIFFC